MVTKRAWAYGWLLVTAVGCSASSIDTGGVGRAAADPGAGDSQAEPKQASEHPAGAGKAMESSATGGKAGSGAPAPSSTAGSSAGSAMVEDNAPAKLSYPGRGFVVHEWGTDTIVVGSDGSLQRGLHHEEEDLPAFVYDRIKAANLFSPASLSVTIKMETPVTYFYSDVPLQVQARVDFPKGVLTQWYPGVSSFMPPVAAAHAIDGTSPVAIADPVLDASFPFTGEMCREKLSQLAGGVLDWGSVDVLERGADVEAKLPKAALDEFSWSYARAVDANPVALPGGETERFLFYRGLGDFELPVAVKTTPGGQVSLTSEYAEPIGSVFFINVDGERGAFTAHHEGIAARGALADAVPKLDDADALETYAGKLGDAVTTALDATGLYHDEAVAMVNTWKRQWFRTPGARLLYVLPQSWTDSSIPLTISPKPEATLRVMLIRVELITPEQEAADVAALASNEAQAHFAGLGRFAEPRLRRALSLSPNAAGDALLTEIRRPAGNLASE